MSIDLDDSGKNGDIGVYWMEFHQIMERYRDQLKTIADIDTLHTLKKNLQDQVTDPALDWKGRMEIYKKVQLVIERIAEIRSEKI